MKKDISFIVDKDTTLLDFLFICYPDGSRKKVKSLLQSGSVFHNGKKTTQFNEVLKKGDQIVLQRKKNYGKVMYSRLKIIEETDDYIVVDKPSGLLTISTAKEKEQTLYHIVSNYVKQIYPKNKIYIVHRLDRDTSGVVVFAKNEKTKHLYQNHWDEMVIERSYCAIVEGDMTSSGTISNYLKENKEHMVYVTKDKKEGKLAITNYQVQKRENNQTWLRIQLKTGRKNQIRVHMQSLGHPVVGDLKYGATTNPYHRLALHADRLVILDPITQQKKVWVSPLPKIFK